MSKGSGIVTFNTYPKKRWIVKAEWCRKTLMTAGGQRMVMSCRKCASGNQRSFKSEMTFAFRELECVNNSPIYICQDVSVCLDCGHLEVAVPPAKLELLKGNAEEPHSRRSSGQAGTVGS